MMSRGFTFSIQMNAVGYAIGVERLILLMPAPASAVENLMDQALQKRDKYRVFLKKCNSSDASPSSGTSEKMYHFKLNRLYP